MLLQQLKNVIILTDIKIIFVQSCWNYFYFNVWLLF